MKAIIDEHMDNLLKPIDPTLTDMEQELKKAVLEHLLQGDYDRIREIQENYPTTDMMNLLGRFETIVPIDLDKLFKTKC